MAGMAAAGASLALAACGADEEPAVERAIRPPAEIVRSLPSAFDAGARPAAGTYAGRVGGGPAYVGLVVRGGSALVYLCDGRESEWFGSPVRDGRVRVRSARGTVVDARVEEGAVSGTIRPSGGGSFAFVADAARMPGVGVFAGPDPAVPGHVRRWIVLRDGVRGVSEVKDGTSNTIAVSEAPPASGETTATSPPPASTPQDGTSNTIMFSEAPAGGGSEDETTSVTDGSSNTVTLSERQPTTTVSDGTSNTVMVGESPPPPPRGSPTASDGSSNTIQFGESESVTSTSTGSATTPQVADGTSNTIMVGETPVNGVAAGDDVVSSGTAAITTCSSKTSCKTTSGETKVTTPPAEPVSTSKKGEQSFFAGGSLLACTALERLARTLLPAARAKKSGAVEQLAAVVAQMKSKRC